jgi:hypothetical protein
VAATGRTNRRSEVNQLADSWPGAGKSGSAKIEGHIKFDLFFDLKPYLTEKLKKQHKNMFCRLFAVIVHAGKNSHSGHYIAYVRDISKNEWWRMDDGRVTPASQALVMQAEAYMLFYRVVQHPVTVRLEELYREKNEVAAEKNRLIPDEDDDDVVVDAVPEKLDTETTTGREKNRKRHATEFLDGVEWARVKTNIPPHNMLGLIRKVHDRVAEDVQLSAEYFKIISKEASMKDAAIGKGPSNTICGTSLKTLRRQQSCTSPEELLQISDTSFLLFSILPPQRTTLLSEPKSFVTKCVNSFTNSPSITNP